MVVLLLPLHTAGPKSSLVSCPCMPAVSVSVVVSAEALGPSPTCVPVTWYAVGAVQVPVCGVLRRRTPPTAVLAYTGKQECLIKLYSVSDNFSSAICSNFLLIYQLFSGYCVIIHYVPFM